jgi:tetratricopeptide (TPR) repeat protein
VWIRRGPEILAASVDDLSPVLLADVKLELAEALHELSKPAATSGKEAERALGLAVEARQVYLALAPEAGRLRDAYVVEAKMLSSVRGLKAGLALLAEGATVFAERRKTVSDGRGRADELGGEARMLAVAARWLGRAGRREEALGLARRALELGEQAQGEAEHFFARGVLARLLREKGSYDEAFAALGIPSEVDVGIREKHHFAVEAVWCAFVAGKVDEARRRLRLCRRTRPEGLELPPELVEELERR